MSQIQDFSDDEFAMAIAAAAFAIASLEQQEEDGSLNQERTVEGLGSSLTTAKSKREDNTIKPTDSSRPFQRSSSHEAKGDGKSAEKTAETDQRMLEDSIANHKNTEKTMGAITMPTITKTPLFTDKYPNDTSSKRVESRKEVSTGPIDPSTIKHTTLLPGKKNRYRNAAESSKVEEADAWEKEQITKIKNRYEKRNAGILEWENEKKTKAKHQMEQKEKGLEQREAKTMQEYHNEISWVDKFAGGARALADEKKRNDESKVRERAQLMRSTGKVRRTCFCF